MSRNTVISTRVNDDEESLIAMAFEEALRVHKHVNFATFIREVVMAGILTPAPSSPQYDGKNSDQTFLKGKADADD